MYPRRGEVWWVSLDPTVGSEIQKTRPCVVISPNVTNGRRDTVVIVPISTSAPLSFPITVEVKGLVVRGVAVLEHVRGVSKERFSTKYDQLDAETMDRIGRTLKVFLGIR